MIIYSLIKQIINKKNLTVLLITISAFLISFSQSDFINDLSDSGNRYLITSDYFLYNNYGLQYPITYEFSYMSDTKEIIVFEKKEYNHEWNIIPQKTEDDFFNGIEASRIDSIQKKIYVSVAFSDSSNQIHLKFVSKTQIPVAVSFDGICRYYDNRKAVVTATADDWNDQTSNKFIEVCSSFRSLNLYLTTAIITGSCSDKTWTEIQNQLDSGCIEAASHSRSHRRAPYYDLTDFEILGSKEDIVQKLNLPRVFKKGSTEYVYSFVAPGGVQSPELFPALNRGKYLVDRGSYEQKSNNFQTWSKEYNFFYSFGYTVRIGPDSKKRGRDFGFLNSLFDETINSGAIYHLNFHPWKINNPGEGYFYQHLLYISNRKDIWYVTLGQLYLYHFYQISGEKACTVSHDL